MSGDCWADTGWDEIGHFGGFDTVVITGSGTLTLSQRLEAGTGKERLPALIVDGVDVTCPEIGLTANAAADDTANLLLLSGSLTAERAAVSGDACVTGGTAGIGLLLDCPRLVCRGGEVVLREGWGFMDACRDTCPHGAAHRRYADHRGVDAGEHRLPAVGWHHHPPPASVTGRRRICSGTV